MSSFISLFLFSLLFSSNISNDSLASLINNRSNLILDEVKYIDPLDGKKIGFEINPLYTMFFNEGLNLSGSFSNFNISKVAEIAFPFKYYSGNDNDAFLSIDAQYRFFLGKHRNGKYIMSGIRLFLGEDNQGLYKKAGISFGFGERVFGSRGLYWGTSLYLGKYYFGDLERGSSWFVNSELLKFGFMF